MQYLKNFKLKKKISKVVIDNNQEKAPFEFKYNTICPAISIIILEADKETFLWISELCNVLNITLNTKKFVINEDDLNDMNRWFNKVFGHNTWQNAKTYKNKPSLWGKYIWALLHIISIFWTKYSSKHINYLIKNTADILPCLKCKKHYKEIILKYEKELDNLDSINSSINLLLSIHEDVDNNKNKYNRVPEGDHTFLELYNYLLPFIEPEDKSYFTKLNKKCSCGLNHN